MALITQGPAFAHWSDNFGSPFSDTANAGFGVGITPGTSSADGTAVTVLPALSHDCEYLWLGVSGIGNSGGANAALMDVLVDPAGGTSWSELISDLLVGFSANIVYNTTPQGVPVEYHFPLWIPAGASVGARIRMQNASAPTGTRVMAVAAGGNRNPASWWCGQKVETVGTMAPSSSLGQIVTPGANVAVSGTADNGSGLIRLTVASTSGWTTGDYKTVSGVTGTLEANGDWQITVIDGTHIDLVGSTFANNWVAGGAVAANFSDWTDLGSTTSARAGACQWALGGPTGNATTSNTWCYEFGTGGFRIGPRVYKGQGTTEYSASLFRGPVFCDIPAGTQLQVRGLKTSTSTATGTEPDCAAYLVQ
jgi:hypothetical protein